MTSGSKPWFLAVGLNKRHLKLAIPVRFLHMQVPVGDFVTVPTFCWRIGALGWTAVYVGSGELWSTCSLSSPMPAQQKGLWPFVEAPRDDRLLFIARGMRGSLKSTEADLSDASRRFVGPYPSANAGTSISRRQGNVKTSHSQSYTTPSKVQLAVLQSTRVKAQSSVGSVDGPEE